jgi:hypothetical protein
LAVFDQQSLTAPMRVPLYSTLPASYFLPLCLQIFPHVVNTSSLAPAHACPAQTSSKNFKHP